MDAQRDPVGGAPILSIVDPDTRPRRVVFIGVDAGRYDYLERFHVPNIQRLITRGVSFRNAVCGSFISETAPGFASLSTGVYAKTHGICTSGRRHVARVDDIGVGDFEELRWVAGRYRERYRGRGCCLTP